MAEVKWIKITTNIFDDEKIKLIDTMPDRDALLVIWFKLLTMAGKTNDNGFLYIIKEMPTTDEMLATIFNRPLNTVRMALEMFKKFGMIEINTHVNIVNWEKHQNIEGMDKIKEQNRLRQQKFKEKQKLLSNNQEKVTLPVTDSNAIELEKELEKEKNKTNIAEIENFFEECWKLYPSKLGKASIKDKKKKEIFNLGEQFKRCIQRYIENKEEWKAYQNGSTFFNSGYVDYLDNNFIEENINQSKNKSEAFVLKSLGINI